MEFYRYVMAVLTQQIQVRGKKTRFHRAKFMHIKGAKNNSEKASEGPMPFQFQEGNPYVNNYIFFR
jgi:hypothetical protein